MNETQSFRLYDSKTQVLEIFSKDLKALISFGDIYGPHFLHTPTLALSHKGRGNSSPLDEFADSPSLDRFDKLTTSARGQGGG